MLSVGRPDVHQCDAGWVPVYTDAQKSLALMSIGFLMEDPDEAVVWRGPKKTGINILLSFFKENLPKIMVVYVLHMTYSGLFSF